MTRCRTARLTRDSPKRGERRLRRGECDGTYDYLIWTDLWLSLPGTWVRAAAGLGSRNRIQVTERMDRFIRAACERRAYNASDVPIRHKRFRRSDLQREATITATRVN